MEEEIVNKKSCINCKYYIEHFIWFNCKFIKANCGHCAVNPNTKKFRKTLPLANGCPKWEDENIKYLEFHERIVSKLKQMSKQINYLVQFFDAYDTE